MAEVGHNEESVVDALSKAHDIYLCFQMAQV